MSDASDENLSSPSLLSNLRTFRFQKKPMPIFGSCSSTSPSLASPNAGTNNGLPIRIVSTVGGLGPSYVGEASASSTTSNGLLNSTHSAESIAKNSCSSSGSSSGGLKGLILAFPTIHKKVIEKCLIRAQGDFERAKEYIVEHFTSGPIQDSQNLNPNKVRPSTFLSKEREREIALAQKRALCNETNGTKAKEKRFKRIKRVPDSDEEFSGSDSDQGGYRKEEKRVFDSDEDSDVEVSNDTSKEQKDVFDFLSNATLSELLCLPLISKKKADCVMELRPFDGWRDMVEKFQNCKTVSTEVLNSAQEFLYTRYVVTQLMNKCSKLSDDLEKSNVLGNLSVGQPPLLNSDLKLANYQLIGLNWLVALRMKGLNGILADEMGLGKTIQVIAFLAWLKGRSANSGGEEKVQLIVVPASTLDNWRKELELWCPTLRVTVYYGAQDERRSIRTSFFAHGARDVDVILTTYNLLTTSPEERKMFRVLKFEYVVFDEAHMLKNMKTIRYEQMSQVNAQRRILLTGTPLQNNLLELMSLLTFVMPNMFQNKKQYLKCLFTKNSTKEKGENQKEESESLPRFEQEQVAQAKKIMKPFVLRRLKKDVLKDLPSKTDIVRNCDMSTRQRTLYDALISTYSKSTQEKSGDDTSSVNMMMQLRKASNHPLLIRELYTDDIILKLAKILIADPDFKEKNLDYAVEDLSFSSDFELHTLCLSYPHLTTYALEDEAILESGKFKVLDELLPTLFKESHRVLIFSQFVIVLNIMVNYMNIRGIKHLRLDGSTPVPVRQELIDEFNSDPSISVFLLSTKAGGLGINLTAADTVIIHDLDFNPYNDKQAEDRCHRVGQTKPVTVYRLISTNSIDEDVYQIAKEKLYLEKEISAEDSDTHETKHLLKKALGLDARK